ncbi:MAG: hypothetical protein ACOC41_08035, partial [Chitinivibrionales bacterium]
CASGVWSKSHGRGKSRNITSNNLLQYTGRIIVHHIIISITVQTFCCMIDYDEQLPMSNY